MVRCIPKDVPKEQFGIEVWYKIEISAKQFGILEYQTTIPKNMPNVYTKQHVPNNVPNNTNCAQKGY